MTSDDILTTLKEMFQDVLQEVLEVEIEEHLSYSKSDMTTRQPIASNNSRNGSYKKTIRTQLGDVDLAIPFDRNGDFEPEIIPKHKITVSRFEENLMLMQLGFFPQIKPLLAHEIRTDWQQLSKRSDAPWPQGQPQRS